MPITRSFYVKSRIAAFGAVAAFTALIAAGCAGADQTPGTSLTGGSSAVPTTQATGTAPLTAAQTSAATAAHLKFDQKAAWKDLLKQCSYGPRDPRLPAHEKCLSYILAQLKPNCDQVVTQNFPYTDSARSVTLNLSNVIGVINPKGAQKVLISAHWDTRPTADMDMTIANRTKPILGADDGASGVAVLLELARALHKQKPNCCVELAFWDGEDWGPSEDKMYLGSTYFASHPGALKPDQSILLDMVGQKKLIIDKEQWSDQHYPALDTAVWSAAAAAGEAAVFPNTIGQEIIDDQIPLAKMNVPSIDVIDFNYPYWHTLQDTPENCDPNALGAVGKAMEQYVRSLGAAPAATLTTAAAASATAPAAPASSNTAAAGG